jgi:hypothetical protein
MGRVALRLFGARKEILKRKLKNIWEGSHSWSSAAVLKTARAAKSSRVRISPLPLSVGEASYGGCNPLYAIFNLWLDSIRNDIVYIRYFYEQKERCIILSNFLVSGNY